MSNPPTPTPVPAPTIYIDPAAQALMYAAAAKHAQKVFSAIAASYQDGTNIHVEQMDGNLKVKATKGEQYVIIDLPATYNYSSVIPITYVAPPLATDSTTPAPTVTPGPTPYPQPTPWPTLPPVPMPTPTPTPTATPVPSVTPTPSPTATPTPTPTATPVPTPTPTPSVTVTPTPTPSATPAPTPTPTPTPTATPSPTPSATPVPTPTPTPTPSPVATGTELYGVAYSPALEIYSAIGITTVGSTTTRDFVWSTDATNWYNTASNLSIDTAPVAGSIVWGNSEFVGSGGTPSTGLKLWRSTDGQTWANLSNELNGGSFTNNLIYADSLTVEASVNSVQGILQYGASIPTTIAQEFAGATGISVAYSGSLWVVFVAFASNVEIWAGTSLTALTEQTLGSTFAANVAPSLYGVTSPSLAYGDGMWVLVANNNIYAGSSSVQLALVESISSTPINPCGNGLYYANSLFMLTGGDTDPSEYSMTSTNGTTWTQMTATTTPLSGSCWDGEKFVAVGGTHTFTKAPIANAWTQTS
jgi:hypothetical protein